MFQSLNGSHLKSARSREREKEESNSILKIFDCFVNGSLGETQYICWGLRWREMESQRGIISVLGE